MPPAQSPESFAGAIRSADRPSLARAITLVESRREDDREYAFEILRLLMPETGRSRRTGISGPPGVGKSTLIDAYGMLLVEQGHRVAVLAVDPSSARSGGSILGDKSRMPRLGQSEGAFVRPSPSDLALGGVTRRTREAMLLCEAAGFDRVLIETVGVGQSEIEVSGMVDSFVVLIQPGAGDELQGIKKGIIELADLLVVTKADGEILESAQAAAAEYTSALRYSAASSNAWSPRLVSTSAREGLGLEELATLLDEHYSTLVESGELGRRREADLATWLRELTEEAMLCDLRRRRSLDAGIADALPAVVEGRVNALRAAVELARAPES